MFNIYKLCINTQIRIVVYRNYVLVYKNMYVYKLCVHDICIIVTLISILFFKETKKNSHPIDDSKIPLPYLFDIRGGP